MPEGPWAARGAPEEPAGAEATTVYETVTISQRR